MKAFAEITNFNVRCGPVCDNASADYEVAVNCVVSDGERAVIKCLSPDIKFTAHHKTAIIDLIRGMGLIPTWKRNKRKDWFMSHKHHIDANTVSDPKQHTENMQSALDAWKRGEIEGHLEHANHVTQEPKGDGILYHAKDVTFFVKKPHHG